ncbi:MAG: group 1 glycosyl transferase [Beggiatoa sp. IS2]|nr:MAG: group 1 glycosyl transferase [Beggiatoa sp. IS2]
MTSTSYPKDSTDWRGVFIKYLVEALAIRSDIDLRLWAPPGEISPQIVNACLPEESIWLKHLIEQGGIAHVLRHGGIQRLLTPVKLLWLLRKAYQRQRQVRLFHVNWLQNALPLWGTQQPALVTVLGSDLGLLKLPLMTTLLRAVFQQRACILAPNADWMVAELERRFGDVAHVRPIPFGIDAKWYQLPRIGQSSPLKRWLVVSRLTKNKIGHLFAWGEKVFQGEQKLHLFGPLQESLSIPSWVQYHGATHPRDLQENWFPQAAGLITLSQHDEGRPQVMLEAMAAGLPIIASRLPAHENLLVHQQTGWLTDTPEDFAQAIRWLADPAHNAAAIGVQARAWVQAHIGTWADCAQRYVTAYHELLS